MKIIIPTKGRANIIHEKALRLFPDTTLCIGEDEVQAYGRHSSNLLVDARWLNPHPLRRLRTQCGPAVVGAARAGDAA